MNSNLQNKLSGFEATPPAGVWDKIAGALDAEQTFPQKLYHYKEQPGANAWTRIASALEQDTSSPGKVVPFTTRHKKPIRYVAAATVLAVALFTGSLFMKKGETAPVETAQQTVVPIQKQIVVEPTRNVATQHTSTLIPTIAAVPTGNGDVHTQPKSRYRRILNFISPQNIVNSVAVSGLFIPEEVDKEAMFDHASLNNYMVYSDGNGNAMKLPKKLFSLVNCPDGDGSCRERIHQLQQKLSANTTNADFAGIMEMLRQLQ